MALKDEELLRLSRTEFGERLTGFRKRLGKTQAEFAEILFREKGFDAGPRIVGQIESGKRAIKKDELDNLLDKYPDFRDYELAAGERGYDLGLYSTEKFADLQQEFLKSNRLIYEMWFVNGAAIPMYESPKLEKTWKDNILEGVNYSILWDLDDLARSEFAQSAFQSFCEIALRVLEGVHAKDPSGPVRNRPDKYRNDAQRLSGVDVYGYLPSRPENESEEVKKTYELGRELYNSYRAGVESETESDGVARFRFHDPCFVSEMRYGCRRLPLDGYFANAATVAYIPKTRLGRAYVNLEPREITTGFKGDPLRERKRAHVFNGPLTATLIANLLIDFEDWYYETCENVHTPLK